MKMTVFWDVAPCSFVEIDLRFRGAYCLIVLMMEAVSTSETSINFYKGNIPEDRHLPRGKVATNVIENINLSLQ
jgi:hypothetical protein